MRMGNPLETVFQDIAEGVVRLVMLRSGVKGGVHHGLLDSIVIE
jgi:hypothetical protein